MPAKVVLSKLDPAAKKALSDLQEPGEPNIYDQLLALFLESSDKFSNTIRNAKQQPDTLKATAHSWKSSAAAVGANGLAALCFKLECNAHSMSQDLRDSLIQEIELEYAEIKTELQSQ
jgi:HPt (histidine-containing phosphotransfer) domain-containing protein